MKKLLWMALMAVCMTANAQDKKNVVLKEGKNDNWTMQVGVGLNFITGAPGEYEFAPFKSWDIQWTVLQYNYKPKGAKQTYSIGLGLNWRNYGLKDNNTSFQKVNDVVGLGKFPANAGSRYSAVHTLGINIPLLFTQDIGKKVSFSVGPIVSFNAWGWVNNDYDIGDDNFDISTRKIGQRPVTVDIMGVLEYEEFGIFCKYSPMSVFKKDRGPEFQSITLGLYL